MKTRQEIKAHAKFAMKEQRGTSILAWLLVIALSSVVGTVAGIIWAFTLIIHSPALLFIGVIILYGSIFFLTFPLSVNSAGVFTKIYNRQQASANEILSNLPVNYWRKVGGMAWMFLFTFLWMLLLFIPGIIKGISYSMTPYILANNPNVTAKEALKLSMRMTNGHKMDLFIMALSFIGWYLLGIFTCGVLWIVFVSPYHMTTTAGYYVELRDKALANGTIHASELEGRLQ